VDQPLKGGPDFDEPATSLKRRLVTNLNFCRSLPSD
jgi:hypothetical protein